MPKSKKPRKKFDPKRHLRHFAFKGLTEVEETVLYEKFLSLELKAETTLAKGLCSSEEIADMMDFLQWGKIAVATRDFYSLDERIEAQKVLVKSAYSMASLMERGIKNEHYVCTADELNSIRDGMSIVGPLMEKSIKETPRRTEKEWCVMLRYSRLPQGKNVDVGQLKADLQRV